MSKPFDVIYQELKEEIPQRQIREAIKILRMRGRLFGTEDVRDLIADPSITLPPPSMPAATMPFPAHRSHAGASNEPEGIISHTDFQKHVQERVKKVIEGYAEHRRTHREKYELCERLERRRRLNNNE